MSSRSEFRSRAPRLRFISSRFCFIRVSYFCELRLIISSCLFSMPFFTFGVGTLKRLSGFSTNCWERGKRLVFEAFWRMPPCEIYFVLSIMSTTLFYRFSWRNFMLISISFFFFSMLYYFSYFLSSSSLRLAFISLCNFSSSFFCLSSSFFYLAFFSIRRRFTRSRHASDFSLSNGVTLFTGSRRLRGKSACILEVPSYLTFTGLDTGDLVRIYLPLFRAWSRLSYFRFYSIIFCYSMMDLDFSASLAMRDSTCC